MQLIEGKLVLRSRNRYAISAPGTPSYRLETDGYLRAFGMNMQFGLAIANSNCRFSPLSQMSFGSSNWDTCEEPKSEFPIKGSDWMHYEPTSIEFSQDYALTKSPTGQVSLISTETGSCIIPLSYQGIVRYDRFSPRGDRFILDVDSTSGRRLQKQGGPCEVWLYVSADGARIKNFAARQLHPAIAAFSSDGLRVATISAGQEIQIWEASTGSLIASLSQPNMTRQYDFDRAEFNRDGSAIWAHNALGIGVVWNISTGELIARSEYPGSPSTKNGFVSFSPDGSKLVASSASHIEILDIASGTTIPLVARSLNDIEDATFSGNGQFLMTYSYSEVYRLWNAETGIELWDENESQCSELLSATQILFDTTSRYSAAELAEGKITVMELVSERKLETLEMPGHKLTLNLLTSNDDNEHSEVLLAASDEEGSVYLWRIVGSTIVDAGQWQKVGASTAADSIAASRDGLSLVAFWGNLGKVIDVQTGAVRPLEAADSANAEFWGDGSIIVSDDRTAAWDVASGRQLPLDLTKSGLADKVKSRKFDESLTRVFVKTFDDAAYLLDVSDGRIIRELWPAPKQKSVAAVSRDVKTMISADSISCRAAVWNVRDGSRIGDLCGHEGSVCSVALSADGTHAVTGGSDQAAILWDVASSKQLRRLTGHSAPLGAVAISANGGRIATGADDGAVALWDGGGEHIAWAPPHESAVQEIQFTSEGRWLVSRSSESVHVCDAKDAPSLAMLRHRGTILGMSVATNGETIATIGSDHVARLWRIKDGQELWALDLPEGGEFVALNDDASRLLVGQTNGVCRLFDVHGRRLIAECRFHEAAIVAAQFTNDGSRILTAARDRTIRVWNPERPEDDLLGLTDAGQPYRFLWLSPGETRLLGVTESGQVHMWDWSGDPPDAVQANRLN